MAVTLRKAGFDDWALLYDMQIKAFEALLDKYHDYEYSPGAEKPERVRARLLEPGSDNIMDGMDIVYYAK